MDKFKNRLDSVSFSKLKNLVDLEISFLPHYVTGIFGANGSGKSTIIYSLLCVFQPIDKIGTDKRSFSNHRFSNFFKSTSIHNWKDSSFEIKYLDKKDNSDFSEKTRKHYKGLRWGPRYSTRPKRCTYFIGINTSIPDIETEKSQSMIKFSKDSGDTFKASLEKNILKGMSEIFDREYANVALYRTGKKSYNALALKNEGEYSSLSMGAGEQRVLRILNLLFTVPKESLIVIDEIDLTLHTRALNKLLDVILSYSKKHSLQIIFTSHREEILRRTDINIRHIQQMQSKTLCFENSNSDCLYSLTGRWETKFQIYVEDAFSEEIVSAIAMKVGIRKECKILKYGSIQNSFMIAGAKVIQNENLDKTLIILDGDKYKTYDQKVEGLKKVFTGTENDREDRLTKAMSMISQYKLPDECNPEFFIYEIIKEMPDDNDIVKIAKSIGYEANKHRYINRIIEEVYQDKKYENHFSKIIDLASKSDKWNDFISNITQRLEELKSL